MIREKNITAGKLFQSDFYPCWSDGRRMPSRAPKAKRSTPEQEKYNKNKAVKEATFLINENFDGNDNILTITFAPEFAPQSEDEARNLLINYIRRLKRFRLKELIQVTQALETLPDTKALADQRKALELKKKKLSAPFKYFYVIEKVTYQRGKYKGKNNWHYHLLLTGGVDRKDLENMWSYGIRCNAGRFQPERFGPEAMAKYMMKDPQGSKRFACSRNMDRSYKNPKIKKSKLSPCGLEKIAKQRCDDREYWEKRYKGYRFLRCYSRYNEYNGHWYVSVIMWKDGDGPLPRWDFDDWQDF